MALKARTFLPTPTPLGISASCGSVCFPLRIEIALGSSRRPQQGPPVEPDTQ